MYRGLIDHLTFVYSFICKGRGKISQGDLLKIEIGARTLADNTPLVMGETENTRQDELDRMECDYILKHIDEMINFFNTTEII